jgi:hypothetical protein
MNDLYYIQNIGYCGNCLKWWRENGNGYTDDLRQAWKVSKEQATQICNSRPKEDIPWPCLVAELQVRYHVTGTLQQALDKIKESLNHV